jgi:hypothetical protein
VTDAVADRRDIGGCPVDAVSLAACDGRLFALDQAGAVWTAPQGDRETWSVCHENASALRNVTAMNGRLFAIDAGDTVLSRPAIAGSEWLRVGDADGIDVLTAQAGRLIGAGGGRPLRRSALLRPALLPGGDHAVDVDRVDRAATHATDSGVQVGHDLPDR